MVTDTPRRFLLLTSLAVALAACQNDEEEYVKTRKGDIVRSRDAEAANITIQSNTLPPDLETEDDDGESE